MMGTKINKWGLNWQAGYHQGLIDQMTRLVEVPEEMLAKAKYIRDLREQLEASAVHAENCIRGAKLPDERRLATLEQYALNIANVTGIAEEARESVRVLALQLLRDVRDGRS